METRNSIQTNKFNCVCAANNNDLHDKKHRC